MPVLVYGAITAITLVAVMNILKLMLAWLPTLNILKVLDLIDNVSSHSSFAEKESKAICRQTSRAQERYAEETKRFVAAEHLGASALFASELFTSEIKAFDEPKEKELVLKLKRVEEVKDEMGAFIVIANKTPKIISSINLANDYDLSNGFKLWVDQEIPAIDAQGSRLFYSIESEENYRDEVQCL